MGITLSNFDPILKQNYDAKVIMDLVTARHPWFALVPKDNGWTGNVAVLPLQYGNPQSVGSGTSNFSTLTSNIGQSAYTKFLLSTAQTYGVIKVDREAFLASADMDGAFADALDREVRSVLKEVGRDIARQLFGTSNNYLGQNTSGTASPITLSAQDGRKFEVGMRVIASANANGSSPRSGVGTVTKVDIDDDAGTSTITYSGTISSLGSSDYIFREAGAGAGISGLGEWLGSDSTLFSVDRSVSYRLQGQSLNAAGLSIEEAFIQAVTRADREGGVVDIIITDHDTFYKLQSSEQGQRRYANSDKAAQLGFEGLMMANGAMVVADRFCPSNTAYALELDSWVLKSRGDLVHFVEDDGRILLRDASSDAVQARVASYAQLGCVAPVHNVVITNLGL